MELQVYRGEDIVSEFDIDEGTVYTGKLNDARKITCPVKSKDVLDLQEGDYILHNEEVYIISTLPDFEKDGSALQKSYNITFEHELYLLLDTYVVNDQELGVFPKYGTAEEHLDMIFASANRNDTGWTVGEVDATGGDLINYNWTYVRTALDDIAAAFKLEWSFTGRTIRMVSQIGVDTGLTFEVGRGKGLHAIKRSADASKSVLTRVWGEGGSRNIDSTYRDGIERALIFEGRYVETPGVTAGTERVREGRYVNENIYPRFEGAVSSVTSEVDGGGLLVAVSITCPEIDFDIMLQLQEGVTAKVSFRTGALTGSEFEISGYNATTHTIEFIPFADTNGYVLPNDLNMPVAGDKFTLLDIRMPNQYEVAAELELKTATQQFLDDNKLTRLLFDAVPDERHLRSNNIVLNEGDRATVIEADADVNEVLRFTEISYPLVNPFRVTAVVGNEIRYNRVVKLFADVIRTQRDVQIVDRRNAEAIKRSTQNLRAFEGSVFDTDGLFDTDKMNIGVLTTALAIIGVKSQNFNLNGVYISDNYNGDPNSVMISGGELIHNEFSNPGDQNIWVMTSLTQSGLTAASLYYVYARCSRTAQVGTWVVTTDQIKPEDVAGFYHFLAGVIYPVNAGTRDSEFSNGIADINPRRIKIGAIESRTGGLKIDLDNNTVYGKLIFGAESSGYANISDKPDLSIYATEDFVDAIADSLQGQIDGSITTWFYAYEPTLANAPATSWADDAERNAHLGDLFYDTVTGYAYRFQLAGGVYGWVKITDTDITLALAKAQEAQDTADGKRRVFTATPVTPYDVGDLWSQGTGGDLMRCNAARSSGAYVAGDWGKAVKYTDDSAVDNLVIGGRNYYKTTTPIINLLNNPTIEIQPETNGFTLTGRSGLLCSARMTPIINSDGQWTISFLGNANAPSSLIMEVCGHSIGEINFTTALTKYEFTVNVTNFGAFNYQFIDFYNIDWINYHFIDFKVERGNKATDWTPAPEDVQAAATQAADDAEAAAIAYADAQDELKAIEVAAYADGIVSAEEARAIADAEAKLELAYADATAKAEAARIAAEAAAAVLVDGVQVGGRNYFKNSTTLVPYQLVSTQHNHGTDPSGVNNYDGLFTVGINGTLGNLRLVDVIKSNGFWTVSGFVNSNTNWPLSVDACDSAIQIVNVIGSEWTRFELTFNVTNYSDGGYNFVDFGDIPWVYLYIKDLKIEKGTRATDWTPAPEDVSADAQAKADAALASANTIALGYANSAASVAQAAAIASAASDATSKANAAQAAAEAASATYAATVANSAASAAEIAAAADASVKADAAKTAAEATAAAAQAALTAALGALAYEDVVEVSKLGTTVISGGMIVTSLLDADYIKANIVNADYVNTLELDAAVITSGQISADRIDVDDLVVRSLSTNTGGQRIEILSISNNMVFYDASDNELVKVDDDSAIEGSEFNDNPPPVGTPPPDYLGSQVIGGVLKYRWVKRGPGISVGINRTDSNGYTTVSRKGLWTTGEVRCTSTDESQYSIINKDGIETKGTLTLSGLTGPTGDRPLRVNSSGQVYRGT